MSTIKVSIHGRQFGLDHNDFLTSLNGAKFPALYLGTSDAEVVVDNSNLTNVITEHSTATTAGTTITGSGRANLASTGGLNTTYTLAAPVAGRRKTIFFSGTSTGQSVGSTTNGATMWSTGGSTHVSFTALRGAVVELEGYSTSQWLVRNNQGVTFA